MREPRGGTSLEFTGVQCKSDRVEQAAAQVESISGAALIVSRTATEGCNEVPCFRSRVSRGYKQ